MMKVLAQPPSQETALAQKEFFVSIQAEGLMVSISAVRLVFGLLTGTGNGRQPAMRQRRGAAAQQLLT